MPLLFFLDERFNSHGLELTATSSSSNRSLFKSFLIFDARSHIDRLHRSTTRVAHNFLDHTTNRSSIDQTSIAHKLHTAMPHTSDHEKTSSSKSSDRILRTRDCDPHCVAILVDIFHERLADLRSGLTTATPSFAHNPSHPCGTLVVSPPRTGVVRGTNHCPSFQTQESLSTV